MDKWGPAHAWWDARSKAIKTCEKGCRRVACASEWDAGWFWKLEGRRYIWRLCRVRFIYTVRDARAVAFWQRRRRNGA